MIYFVNYKAHGETYYLEAGSLEELKLKLYGQAYAPSPSDVVVYMKRGN